MSRALDARTAIAVGAAFTRSERDEIADVSQLACMAGMVVCSTQQFRPSQQFEGIADLYVFDPYAKPRAAAFWWEGKAVDGILSVKQQNFALLCARCNVPIGTGTLADFCVFLGSWRGLRPTIPAGCAPWRVKLAPRGTT